MRHVLFLVLGLALGALAVHAVAARADGEDAPAPAPQPDPAPVADPSDPGARLDAMYARHERETAVLRTEIEYLRSREAALTRYVLAMNATSSAVKANVASARREGFEAAAVPAPSRITVLRALEQLAADLTGALPVPSANENALQRKIEALRRAAGWK